MEFSIKEQLDYWRQRCEAAEDYISESPCDHNMTTPQLKAYWKWKELKDAINDKGSNIRN